MQDAAIENKEKPNTPVIYGAPEGQDARILALKARALADHDGILVHVALDDTRVAVLEELLSFFAPDVKIVSFPAWDCLPYDRVSPNGKIVARRVAALTKMLAWEKEAKRYPRIVLTTVNAMLQKVMPKGALEGASFSAKTGGRLELDALQSFLSHNGYTRTETVREPGEYAMRGGIIDLFPPGNEEPLRVDLFGSDIESIRSFDPLSQRSNKKVSDFSLQPVTEFFLDEESIGRFRSGYREAFGVVRDDDPLYEAVSAGRRYNGMEHWLPLFYDGLDTVFDYLPHAVLTMDHHDSEAKGERLAQIEDFYQARKTLEEAAKRKDKKAADVSLSGAVYHPLPVEMLYTDGDWQAEELSPFSSPHPNPLPEGEGTKGRDFADIRALPDGDLFGALKKHISTLMQDTAPSPSRGEGWGEGGDGCEGGKACEGNKESKASQDSIEFARGLRKQQTETEKLLWNQLRNRALKEYKFRRQHPVGPYFADFICLEKGLIIEVDGDSHNQTVEKDLKRTQYMEAQGYRVIRFSNDDVRGNLEGVVQSIGHALEQPVPLTPALSPEGRGGCLVERKLFIAAYSEGAAVRLKGLMEVAGIGPLIECPDFESIKKLGPNQIGLGVLHLENGFVSPDLAVLTEQDILGDRLARKSQKRKKADNFLREVSALSEGDLVVHVDHGVGKFLALETVKAAKTLHDCLKIEYAGGDKLFVPVENIDVLSRFGADEGSVQLDKLGGAGWQARKARVKIDLMVMADHLLQIAAARQLKKAEHFQISDGLYNEFAARFPYEETEDQARAITDVLGDLNGDYPMDRLICGDVGFGKTEVALRAAYVAAMSGAQVAVVVPTTLLARQHTQNFMARFSGTGLRIGQLSRLVSAKDTKSTKEGLADGSVNIVIGTHALFGDGVKFANLGLLVVDEEQRFGVKQKEKLKELKNNVHVLTLTATPIPRTLQMSLTGVKEMSLIASPPVDRLAIRTFVLPFDPVVVREALLREHYRGGQSFYVCPRIKDMEDVEAMLKELVPEVKLITAHGQMTPEALEDRMSAFYDGKYDVLLATNIIESGLDIPSANTMIIHRSDLFGLSQLYQIRGRIGRSKIRAYAYLTYQPHIKLNPQAQKRLEVMETLDTLGSGFQLASHDMDIRGAGNLLGDQQSGHIREVGVELYQQMLEEAVAAAREGTDVGAGVEARWSPQINIGTSVLIPETYVEDLNVRMSLYRRLADLTSSPSPLGGEGRGEGDIKTSSLPPHPNPLPGGRGDYDDGIESFAAELIDRFGEIPDEVNNLLDIVSIKQLCKISGVGSVEAGPKGAVIGFHKDSPPNVEALMKWITEKGGAIKLRPDQKLVVIRQWDSPAQRVKGVRRLMKELSVLP